MKKPRVGDTVTITDAHGDHTGEVYHVGSAQFSIFDPDTLVTQQNGTTSKGLTHSCLFNSIVKDKHGQAKEGWTIVRRRKVSRAEIRAAIKAKKLDPNKKLRARRQRRRKKKRNTATA